MSSPASVPINNATVYREACKRFLPTNREEMSWRGWDELDVLLISGDAYVDHPTFGIPCLGRWLERLGLRVGIVSQPRWMSPDDFLKHGKAAALRRRLLGDGRQHDQ